MIRGGIWQKQKRPSLCVVRWCQRCLATPASRGYASPGGWGSGPMFAKLAFAPPVTSSGSELLPHEIAARKRAARLLEQEEQKRARDKPVQPALKGSPSRRFKPVTRAPLTGPGAGFSRAPPEHPHTEAKPATPKKHPATGEPAEFKVHPWARREEPRLRPPIPGLTTSKNAPLPRGGIGRGAGMPTESQQASRQSAVLTSGDATRTRIVSQETKAALPSRPGPKAPPTLKPSAWRSGLAFVQPAFAPSSSLDTLLPHEREARDRAARLVENQKPTKPALESVTGTPTELPFRDFEPKVRAVRTAQAIPNLRAAPENPELPFQDFEPKVRRLRATRAKTELPLRRFFEKEPGQTSMLQRRAPSRPAAEGEEWGQLRRKPEAARRADMSLNADPLEFWEAAKEKYPSGLPEMRPGIDNHDDPWAKMEATIYKKTTTPAAKSPTPFFDTSAVKPQRQVRHPETCEPEWNSSVWDSAEAEVGELEPQSGWAVRHQIASQDPTLAWPDGSGRQDASSTGRVKRRTAVEIEKERQDRVEKEARARKRDRGDGLRGREEDIEDDDDSYQERRRRRLERKGAKERAKQEALLEAGPIPILLPEFISVANLGVALGVKQDIFVSQLEELGFENIAKESILTGETAALVAQEYGFDPTVEIGEEEDLKPRPPPEDPSSLPLRPPVVTIMGHVDHGKTTLLDYLRKSSIVSQEHGGITQHIGAFSVNLSSGKQITFLDTPGHAAFLTMRQRGANVTDMVILVVAADDSVKPQTLEALKHARGAKVPIIVAINKVDKDSANVDRVKSDLAANGVEIEDFGGDVQAVSVSGKTGQGMGDLEESILTLSEMLDIRAETDGMAEGWVLESSIKPIGRVATVLVKRGTLRTGDHIVAGRVAAKIRSLRNEAGVEVDEAPPGTAVEILGWKEPPDAGDQVLQAPSEDRAKRAAHYRQELKDRQENIAQQTQQDNERREKALAEQLAEGEEEAEEGSSGPKMVNFTVKGDVHGSVEAVCAAVLEIGSNEVRPRVLHSAPGQITESDVEHAAISGSTILNFNNPIPGHIKHMAEESGVKILNHNVIYHLAEAVRNKLSDYLTPILKTRVTGEAEILQVFPINVKGRVYRNVAGCRVRNGAVARNTKVRVTRDGEQIFEGHISSLKHGKRDMSEIKKGSECGISFSDDWSDFHQGDQIQTIEDFEEKRHL